MCSVSAVHCGSHRETIYISRSDNSQPRHWPFVRESKEEVVEPGHSLDEGLLLGKLLELLLGIRADAEAVGNAREEIDLVGEAQPLENLF